MHEGIKKLFIDELRDIYSAELQLIKALPKMIKAAEWLELREALAVHLEETREQALRIETIFDIIEVSKKPKLCRAMQGLIEEAGEAIHLYKKSFVRDAAIISKAQRIEHYEISGYGTLRTFASELGWDVVEALLETSLKEERRVDKKLTKIAEGGIFTTGVNAKAK